MRIYNRAAAFLLFSSICILSIKKYEAESIVHKHRKRAYTAQQTLDEVLNQQLLKHEQFLKEQQELLEAQKQEQLRQLQDLQVQLFRTQQQQEVYVAEYQANLNQQKISQLNQNRPAGLTAAELATGKSRVVIAEDGALGGANSNTQRKIENEHKLTQQLAFEQMKKQILAQQQSQIDAMNTQNRIQAETRNDQQEALIESKLQIDNQLANQRDQLEAQIEAHAMDRKIKAVKLQRLIDNDGEPKNYEVDSVPQFGSLVKSEERRKLFEEQLLRRKKKYQHIQEERLNQRKLEQIRQAEKLQEVLHETQTAQEAYEKRYQTNLENQKQEQLKQSKIIQENLHQTQRQLEAENEHQHGVMVMEAEELAAQVGDQATRNQKMIIKQHQERVRLSHKMQQDHRLTQDINHQTKKEDIEIQQSQQNDHMHNQHEIQYIERLKQKEALENLRNQLLEQQKSMRQKQTESNNQETIYLEPRSFTEIKSKSDIKHKTIEIQPSLNQLEEKRVTITTFEEPEQVKSETNLEIIATKASINKTIETSCSGKKDGMYRNENDCSSYYTCTSESIYQFACPIGTHFNMDHCTCDWPSETTECITPLFNNQCKKSSHEPEVKSEKNSELVSKADSFTCDGKEKGFYRDLIDCTKFYYCEVFDKPAPYNGQTIIKNDFFCPNSYHFDVFTCKCTVPTQKTCSRYALTSFCTHS